ncbi:putative amino-acid permease [Emericellopsis cladophorae]|uniref:Amino-acid permease n=1 Tax=Emericellopsis cladophorae TaxID=2686198 RepID=A0A9Q0BE68_9HYPO|nr:putative amino-acid permease [Emericellopsis cladophorae]KAI6782612.1 putative amino-acid permease [Emericellopsis cladophorae]
MSLLSTFRPGQNDGMDSSSSSPPPHMDLKHEQQNYGGEAPAVRRPSKADGADGMLEGLGYKPELTRSRSTLQVAFMSFVLASIPWGLSTTLYYPLVNGGPVTIIWGWILVSAIILCVAASLGVYYQAFMLAPARWQRVASWICGWLYLVGNITITLSVTFGATTFIVACINVFESSPGASDVFPGTTWQIWLLFLAITLVCNAISALGNKWLPMLDTAAIFWTFAGVIAMVISVLVLAKEGRRSANYVFTHWDNSSGWPNGWSFFVGLLHAGYATSSTGMIISMCEEVRDPSTQVPKAMVATIVINTLGGLLFLIPIVFVLPDIQMLINIESAQPIPTIFKSAVGSAGGAFGLLIPLIALCLMCSIACTTATSRCVWAFARDGAIPGAKLWMKVNKKLDVPVNAMMLSMIVQLALGLIYFGSTLAFNAFSGVGVICLTAAYACPIAINLFTGRKQVRKGNFFLGPLGYFTNIVALAWTLLALPLFCMPTSIPVTADTLNYAFAVFIGAAAISGIWYAIWGYNNYAGPPTQEEEL